METVADFIVFGSKVTVDSDCSHEVKRHLLFGREAITTVDSIFKSRDINFLTKVHIFKAMFFPVVMCGCQIWTMKKAGAEELMFLNCAAGQDAWESLGLQGDPTSPPYRRSVLGVHWKDWCWSWSSNTSGTWCKELTLWKRPWCRERRRAGEGGGRGWEVGWHHWLDGRVCTNSRRQWRTGKPVMLQSTGSQSQTRLGETSTIAVIILAFLNL